MGSKVQVLVAAMHQNDHSLLEKMNIQSDVIVGNQCDRDHVERFAWKGHEAVYLNFAERGVGLNRNNSLMRATADICLFADDDVKYCDGYERIIAETYEKHPKADVIIFNMKASRNGEPFHDIVHKDRFIGRKEASAYGTFSISAKTDSIKKKNIVFHRMFGGGAAYSHGEDSVFLRDCLSRGLKIFTSTNTIGTVCHSVSTWFSGYNEKYFFDKGVVLHYMYPVTAPLLAIYHTVKHSGEYKAYGVKKAMGDILSGIRHAKRTGL